MKTQCFRIKRSRDSNLWLDSYDGTCYQWTISEDDAWPFVQESNAMRRLKLVQQSVPTAVVVSSSF